MYAAREAADGVGPHLLFHGYGCAADRLGDEDRIYALLETLPDRVGMTSAMPPCVFRHAVPGRGGEGISGFRLTSESHIALHTFPQRHFLNVDMFSCRTFDVELVLAALKRTFAPRRVEWRLLDRRPGLPGTIGPERATPIPDRARVARDKELEALR